jgi:putative DNA methylase
LLSGDPIPEEYVKAEGMAGRLGARLLAIVAEGAEGRVYLPPVDDHGTPSFSTPQLEGIDAPIALDKRALWCLLYGLDRVEKLFTSRQLMLHSTTAELII